MQVYVRLIFIIARILYSSISGLVPYTYLRTNIKTTQKNVSSLAQHFPFQPRVENSFDMTNKSQ